MILVPDGNAMRPFTWSPSLCVMRAVFTGLGVIFAISASRSLAPGSVCFASTTITLLWPTMIVTLPPAPPSAAQMFGLICFIAIGGGAGACVACCAAPIAARAISPTSTRTEEGIRDGFMVSSLFTARTVPPAVVRFTMLSRRKNLVRRLGLRQRAKLRQETDQIEVASFVDDEALGVDPDKLGAFERQALAACRDRPGRPRQRTSLTARERPFHRDRVARHQGLVGPETTIGKRLEETSQVFLRRFLARDRLRQVGLSVDAVLRVEGHQAPDVLLVEQFDPTRGGLFNVGHGRSPREWLQ